MTTLADLKSAARAGAPVFITDVRAMLERGESRAVQAVLVLPDGASVKRFSVPIVEPARLGEAERELQFEFVRASIYNHLVTLGGASLTLYPGTESAGIRDLLERVVAEFQIDLTRAERSGFARIVNVLDRMADALRADVGETTRRFRITIKPLDALDASLSSIAIRAERTDLFTEVTRGLDGTLIAGLDVGGTDIKGALAMDGRLVALKEYDWNPARSTDVEAVIDPIVTIARLLRARAAVSAVAADDDLATRVNQALDPHATLAEMDEACALVERRIGGVDSFDAIGICFPDVVVRNRIVGGEVPKTQGMRSNPARDYEKQFSALSRLNAVLGELCAPGGVVMNTNDGPMAAFTAAVELAASADRDAVRDGVFAHTLGTDLGTGLVLADGTIPEIPLEAYNLVLDLGSDAARALPPADLRSLANTNSGIAGTPQKLASQAAAFRIADHLLWSKRPDLVRDIEALGFVVDLPDGVRVVPESPKDMRKPYLAHLMALAERDEDVAEVFRLIGESMAIVYDECEHILDTGLTQRFLFGRFVKSARCFELMQEGAARRGSALQFVAADGEMAYTPLMAQLEADPDYTVAQFGQAVGAIYFGNSGRSR